MLNEFLLALQFLTVIPVKIRDVSDERLAASLKYFPLVGLLLGLILAGIYQLLSFAGAPDLVKASVLTVTLVMLTGGIHDDGLADTCDALGSGKDREAMLGIMRDSRIGAMGVLGLFCVLILKVALLTWLMKCGLKAWPLILMTMASRWAMVVSMFLAPYARATGKAKAYMRNKNKKTLFIATIWAGLLAVLLGPARGLGTMGIVFLTTLALTKNIERKLGGVTGDTLGALNEITEIVVLIACCAIIQAA